MTKGYRSEYGGDEYDLKGSYSDPYVKIICSECGETITIQWPRTDDSLDRETHNDKIATHQASHNG